MATYFHLLRAKNRDLLPLLLDFVPSPYSLLVRQLCGESVYFGYLDSLELDLTPQGFDMGVDGARARRLFRQFPSKRESLFRNYRTAIPSLSVDYDAATRALVRTRCSDAKLHYGLCVETMHRDDGDHLREVLKSEAPGQADTYCLAERAIKKLAPKCLEAALDHLDSLGYKLNLHTPVTVKEFEIHPQRVEGVRRLLLTRVEENNRRRYILDDLICCWRAWGPEKVYAHDDLHHALTRGALRSVWVLVNRCGLSFEQCCYDEVQIESNEDAESTCDEYLRFGFDISLCKYWPSATWCVDRVIDTRRPVTKRVKVAFLKSQCNEDCPHTVAACWEKMSPHMTLDLGDVELLNIPQLAVMWDDIPEKVRVEYMKSETGFNQMRDLMEFVRERWD